MNVMKTSDECKHVYTLFRDGRLVIFSECMMVCIIFVKCCVQRKILNGVIIHDSLSRVMANFYYSLFFAYYVHILHIKSIISVGR